MQTPPKKSKALVIIFSFVSCLLTQAQDSTSLSIKKSVLPSTVKYVDIDGDGSISLYEAKIIFDKYRSNQDKHLNNDLVDEVESTVIELISHMESIDCNDIKYSLASKRFIEVYYKNKFTPDNSRLTAAAGSSTATNNANYQSEIDAGAFDFPESIETDRPDQTECSSITPPGFFQIETGTQKEFDNDKENKVNTESTLYNTTLWKYGVTKNFEFRLITEFANDKIKYKSNLDGSDTTISVQGFNPVAVGAKMHLQKARGIIPEISLIAHLELPYFGSDDYKPQYVIPRFRFTFAHDLTERISIGYNLGAEWEDGTSASTMIYTATMGASIIGNLSMFVEAYGFMKENAPADHRLDAGFVYLLNKNMQVDCSGGIGLSPVSPDYFLSLGFSFRFNAFNQKYRNFQSKIKG